MRPSMPPVTKWLLIINAVIFLIDVFGRSPGEKLGPINEWGVFRIESGWFGGQLWQLLTFQFLHLSLAHVLFNSIAMFIFGPFVERHLGARRFIAYYLICGIAGGLFFVLLWWLGLFPKATVETPLLGASAGVFGLLFAVYRLAPNVQVQLLFPPITLTMRQLAMFASGYAVFMIIGGLMFPDSPWFWNSGGEAGHLGGALMGLLLMRFPELLNWAEGSKTKIVRPAAFGRRTKKRSYEAKIRPRTELELAVDDEIDRILDKVSEEGFGSLTPEERETLQEASKQKK